MAGTEDSIAAVGLDLAWSERHPTGATALDGAGWCISEETLVTHDEIVRWVVELVDGSGYVSWRWTVRSPNPSGRRPCETEISRRYGSREASAHSSNRTMLQRIHGPVRGEDLMERLTGLGFGSPWADGDRTVIEVHPHPALVEIFDLP